MKTDYFLSGTARRLVAQHAPTVNFSLLVLIALALSACTSPLYSPGGRCAHAACCREFKW